jgi:hypothetical protein
LTVSDSSVFLTLERSALSRISVPESATFIVILLYFVGSGVEFKAKKDPEIQ